MVLEATAMDAKHAGASLEDERDNGASVPCVTWVSLTATWHQRRVWTEIRWAWKRVLLLCCQLLPRRSDRASCMHMALVEKRKCPYRFWRDGVLSCKLYGLIEPSFACVDSLIWLAERRV